MFTLNGWGTALYGNAHRQEIDAASTEFAQRNGLPAYSFQAVKWFTAAFLPIVPLGIYRAIKVKRGSLLFGSSEYVMEPVPWDRRQVITHYLVGWLTPLALIGTIAGLETLDQYVLRRGITAFPIAPFAFLSLVVGGIAFLVWWLTRPPSMQNVGPAPPAGQGSLPGPLDPDLQLVPPIRTSPQPATSAEPVGSQEGLTRRLVTLTITLVALFASGVAVLGCAGGTFLIFRTVASQRASELAQRDARAGQPVGPDTRLAKGTRLQVRRHEWEDVEVVQESEFGMVRVRWLRSQGRPGPRVMFMARGQLRWPLASRTRNGHE